MKDWHIRRFLDCPIEPDLIHQHDESVHKEWNCYRESDGRWTCGFCQAEAPKEICFLADLAGCWEG